MTIQQGFESMAAHIVSSTQKRIKDAYLSSYKIMLIKEMKDELVALKEAYEAVYGTVISEEQFSQAVQMPRLTL